VDCRLILGAKETEAPGLRLVGSGDGSLGFGFSARGNRIAHGRAIGGLVSARVVLVVVRELLDVERAW